MKLLMRIVGEKKEELEVFLNRAGVVGYTEIPRAIGMGHGYIVIGSMTNGGRGMGSELESESREVRQMTELGMRKMIAGDFDEVLAKVPEALKAEGFGVLTEIDVRETLKKKLDVDFRRYKILGACNPPLAHRALQAEIDVGLMLPCNVIVYDAGDGNTVVSAVDPMQTIAAGASPEIRQVADEVRQKLTRVLDRL